MKARLNVILFVVIVCLLIALMLLKRDFRKMFDTNEEMLRMSNVQQRKLNIEAKQEQSGTIEEEIAIMEKKAVLEKDFVEKFKSKVVTINRRLEKNQKALTKRKAMLAKLQRSGKVGKISAEEKAREAKLLKLSKTYLEHYREKVRLQRMRGEIDEKVLKTEEEAYDVLRRIFQLKSNRQLSDF